MTDQWRDMIKMDGVDLRDLIRAAYDLSGPQGLGYIHYRAGGLSDEEVDRITSRESGIGQRPIAASMDYVNGRAVKMTIRRDPSTGDLYIDPQWYDHSRPTLEALLGRFNKPISAIDAAIAGQEAVRAEWQAEAARLAAVGVAHLREAGRRVSTNDCNDEMTDALYRACDAGLVEIDYATHEFFLVEPKGG